jgi:hypothetical protein
MFCTDNVIDVRVQFGRRFTKMNITDEQAWLIGTYFEIDRHIWDIGWLKLKENESMVRRIMANWENLKTSKINFVKHIN